jgi:hypothetical protein
LTSLESTAWVFPSYFHLPYLPEGTCFQQAGSSLVKGISQAVLGSTDQLEGTSQAVTIFEKLKNPSSPLGRKKT